MDSSLISLGSLFDQPTNTPALDRVKVVLEESLPDGWREWQVDLKAVTSLEDDSNLRNKIRFAIPTVALFEAFFPGISPISENKCKEIKLSLLNWPVGRTLIYAPSSVSQCIHPAALHEKFLRDVEPLRYLFLSRSEANSIMQDKIESDMEGSIVSKSISTPKVALSLNDRVGSLESAIVSIQSRMQELGKLLRHEQLSDDAPCQEEELNESDSDPWDQKPIIPSTFFKPMAQTNRDIMQPPADLLAQGIRCQRLGEQSWADVRYAEAEKKLRRGAVFQPLAMNPQLEGRAEKADFALRRQERLLGTLTFGLLAQRKVFKEGTALLAKRCPESAQFFDECLLGKKTDFRSVSEALIQLVCGKRQEVIAERRAAVETDNSISQRQLQEIPPSATHIFDEEAFSKWVSTNPTQPAKDESFLGKKRSQSDRSPPPSKKLKISGYKSRQDRSSSSNEKKNYQKGYSNRCSDNSRSSPSSGREEGKSRQSF